MKKGLSPEACSRAGALAKCPRRNAGSCHGSCNWSVSLSFLCKAEFVKAMGKHSSSYVVYYLNDCPDIFYSFSHQLANGKKSACLRKQSGKRGFILEQGILKIQDAFDE